MTPVSSIKVVAALCAALFLAGCDSAEERAEAHYQSGLELLEAGDVDRALVEFRNVFKLNGSHREARQTYARVVRARGDAREAYGQYLRLVEQYPDDAEGRLALAEMAFFSQNWEEFERHAPVAIEALPDDPAAQAVAIGSKYRGAIVPDEDAAARDAVVAEAAEMRQTLPDNEILLRVLVDGAMRQGDAEAALAAINATLALSPDDRGLYRQRLRTLIELGREDEIEAQLRDEVTQFPEDDNAKAMLIRFYLARQELDEAEAFLRSIVDPSAEDPGHYPSLIQFLREFRGPDAALAELETAISSSPNPLPFRAIKANIDFNAGRRDEAVADLEAALEQAGPEDNTGPVRVGLARMLTITGNEVGARRLVEQVLADDPSQVEALKMQARWLIQQDDTDGAIASLRRALDDAPQDTKAMTLMAEAYVRAGNQALARDFLALAVEASGNAPQESILYARALASEERYLPAEDVLISALRVSPNNIPVLADLGQIYLAMEDLPRAEQVLENLRRLKDPDAKRAADGLQVQLLEQNDGAEEAIAFLEGLATEDEGGNAARLAVIRARLASGEAQAALDYAQTELAANPEDPTLRFAVAATRAATGDLAGAEEDYRAILADTPNWSRAWLELARVLVTAGRPDDATTAVDDGLSANPGAPELLWAKAGNLERAGDIDSAIEIYETLYERSSNSVIVANNLASLLSTYRNDPESLDRAWAVARRLRGTEIPAFQDTYGWIAHRRGETEEAISYLEPAAKGLPQDALVQYHLGAAYLALDRTEEALAQFQRSVEIAGPDDTRPQIAEARAEIERLQQ